MRSRWLLAGIGLLAAVLAIGAVACGDDDEGEDPAATEAPDNGSSAVNVTLLEYQIVPDQDTVAAGSVTFNASNIGGAVHELVVVKTDVAPDALPVIENHVADESAEEIAVIGRIEEFAAQSDASITIDLEAGSYVLICNIVEDTGTSHYEEGMHKAFTISE